VFAVCSFGISSEVFRFRRALKEWFDWYFSVVQQFREVSLQLRLGLQQLEKVVFPEGTYHPPSVPLAS